MFLKIWIDKRVENAACDHMNSLRFPGTDRKWIVRWCWSPGLFRPPFRGWSKKAEQPFLGSELCFRVASCRFAATRKKRSPTAFFGGTSEKLKNETIRSTSMSPIRKNYVLATVFDGGVKDRRNEKKKRKLYVFKMYGRSTGYLPTYLRFCSLKYLSTD